MLLASANKEHNKKEQRNVRELRPFDPMLRTAHLESEPIKVIIDYIDSPSEDSLEISPLTTGREYVNDDGQKMLKQIRYTHSPALTNTCSISTISHIEEKRSEEKYHPELFTFDGEHVSINNKSKR